MYEIVTRGINGYVCTMRNVTLQKIMGGKQDKKYSFIYHVANTSSVINRITWIFVDMPEAKMLDAPSSA